MSNFRESSPLGVNSPVRQLSFPGQEQHNFGMQGAINNNHVGGYNYGVAPAHYSSGMQRQYVGGNRATGYNYRINSGAAYSSGIQGPHITNTTYSNMPVSSTVQHYQIPHQQQSQVVYQSQIPQQKIVYHQPSQPIRDTVVRDPIVEKRVVHVEDEIQQNQYQSAYVSDPRTSRRYYQRHQEGYKPAPKSSICNPCCLSLLGLLLLAGLLVGGYFIAKAIHDGAGEPETVKREDVDYEGSHRVVDEEDGSEDNGSTDNGDNESGQTPLSPPVIDIDQNPQPANHTINNQTTNTTTTTNNNQVSYANNTISTTTISIKTDNNTATNNTSTNNNTSTTTTTTDNKQSGAVIDSDTQPQQQYNQTTTTNSTSYNTNYTPVSIDPIVTQPQPASSTQQTSSTSSKSSSTSSSTSSSGSTTTSGTTTSNTAPTTTTTSTSNTTNTTKSSSQYFDPIVVTPKNSSPSHLKISRIHTKSRYNVDPIAIKPTPVSQEEAQQQDQQKEQQNRDSRVIRVKPTVISQNPHKQSNKKPSKVDKNSQKQEQKSKAPQTEPQNQQIPEKKPKKKQTKLPEIMFQYPPKRT